jgi:hypothetical protein
MAGRMSPAGRVFPRSFDLVGQGVRLGHGALQADLLRDVRGDASTGPRSDRGGFLDR